MLVLTTMLTLIAAMLSTLMSIAWRVFGRPRHALTWVVAFGLGAGHMMSISVLILVGWGDRRHGSPLAFLMTAMLALLFHGLRQRAGYPDRGRTIGIGWALASLAIGALALISAQWEWSTLAVKLYSSYLLVAAASCVTPRGRPSTSAERGTIAIFSTFAIVELVLAMIALASATARRGDIEWAYASIGSLATPAVFTGTGLFLVFLIAADLSVRMQRLASTDGLTGLLNRRGLDEATGLAARRVRRRGESSVIVADLDCFKQVNDRFGHAAGDAALRCFADLARDTMRRGEMIGRIGGEEFALLLPGVTPAAAMVRADQLRTATAALAFPDQTDMRLTASFGVAPLRVGQAGLRKAFLEALAEADRALLRAKAGGRNRVLLAAGAAPII